MPKVQKRGVFFLSLPLQRRMMSQSNFLMLAAEDSRTVRECLGLLSERQRDMLTGIATVNEGEPVSRSELAGEWWGQSRLLGYQIKMLAHLVDRGLTLEMKSGRTYLYRVLPGVRAVMNDEEEEAARKRAAVRREKEKAEKPEPVELPAAPRAPAPTFTSTIIRPEVRPLPGSHGNEWVIDERDDQEKQGGLLGRFLRR